MLDDRQEGFQHIGRVVERVIEQLREKVEKQGRDGDDDATRIVAGLTEAVETARLASSVALIIQRSREEGVTATRTAYRILGRLGVCKYHEPKPEAAE